MIRFILHVFFLWVHFCQIRGIWHNSEYYYWKEYTGVIPPDAIPGGRDADGRNTYIGEAYVHNCGLVVAQIYPGIKEVNLPCYGFKTTAINIKVLCTDHPEVFYWLKTSATTYYQDTANVDLVIAGYDNNDNNGYMNVGRIFFQGYVIVGDVTPFHSRKNNVQLWYPFNNAEHAANFYNVLVIDVSYQNMTVPFSNYHTVLTHPRNGIKA